MLFEFLLIEFAFVNVHHHGVLRDRAVQVVDGGIHDIIPATVFRADHFPGHGFAAQYPVVDAPGAWCAAAESIVAVFTGGIIAKVFDHAIVEVFDRMVHRAYIYHAVKGIHHGIKKAIVFLKGVR